MSRSAASWLALVQAVPAAAAPVAAARPMFTITQVASGLDIPWDVAQTPDGTLIFNERSGGLSVRRTNGTVGEPERRTSVICTPSARPV
ncbi:MAG: hypothetical protein WKF47_19120 [Geodermatophilaceae bacterium]